MRRLLGQDTAFWYGETPTWHMHVGSLIIVDRSEAPDFGYEAVRDLFVSRLHLVPQFRWKVVETPLHLDKPYWVEDEHLDPEFHIRHTAVPPPGGRKQVEDLVSRIMAIKLDRSRPLWELWVIEGLPDDKVGILSKIHHAVIDGVSGAGLGEVLLDVTPEIRDTSNEGRDDSLAGERQPGDVELLARGVVNTVLSPLRMLRQAAGLATVAPTLGRYMARKDRPSIYFESPKTRLNGELTAHRRFSGTTVELERVKAVKTAFGVKLNDVLLALVSEAIRGYLDELDELPASPLTAQVPVSLRTEDDASVGNKVGTITVSLATHIEDPAERLRAIHASSQSAKEMRQAMSARSIQGITDTAHPRLLNLAARAYTAVGLSDIAVPVSVVVSNVPGPPFPLYMAGAKVTSILPIGPPVMGVALNVTMFSYIDRVDVGFITVPELVPNVDEMVDRIPAALDALEAAMPTAAAEDDA